MLESWFRGESESDVCESVGGSVVVSAADEAVLMSVVGEVWSWLFSMLALVVVDKTKKVEGDARAIVAAGLEKMIDGQLGCVKSERRSN